jgi:aminoglycoside 6'-N-acetyltransferase I
MFHESAASQGTPQEAEFLDRSQFALTATSTGREVWVRRSMRLEPLLSAADADWLPLRCELWPDCPVDGHLQEMDRFLREPGRFAQFIVRTPDGRGMGFAEASIRTDHVNGTESSPVGYLEGLFVRAEARGQGVARLLVDAVSEWAAARGCSELASDTQPENRVSQAVHLRLGFTETERAVFYSRPLQPKPPA